MDITSINNPKIQFIRSLLTQKKARIRENAFVGEGVRLIEESLKHDYLPEMVLYSEAISNRGADLIQNFTRKAVPCFSVDAKIMEQLSATETSQGIVGLFQQQKVKFKQTLELLLIVDGVRDPGNLGTLLRTALAANMNGVVAIQGTVDLYSPKVVRAGMGAHFQLPLLSMEWLEFEERVLGRHPKLTMLATVVSEGESIWQVDMRGPIALVIGSEADGVSSHALELCDHRITIPMPGESESLNAGIAGSIVIFEAVRQRFS